VESGRRRVFSSIHPRVNPDRKNKKELTDFYLFKVAGGKEHKHTRDTFGAFGGPKIKMPGE
jgi:hypothetical protein